MSEEIIYSSEFAKIAKKADGFYIESFKKGLSLDELNKVILVRPDIKISNLFAIKNALINAPHASQKFADIKDRIIIEISSDELKAFVTLNIPDEELAQMKRMNLVKEIISKLVEKKVVFGIKQDVLLGKLESNSKLLVAEGTAPINGEDSVITSYELKEPKPELREDDRVDHYDLKLIDMVKIGDWLGERLNATPGIPGKSVLGNTIPAMPGKNYPLLYDKGSVREVNEGEKTVLYSLKSGAVHFSSDRIGVFNHLEIGGDVDFKTGNIDFDGFVTLKGTVEDNFSIVADKDVEVLGEFGVGSVKEIISREGRVYIKGGIAGKSKAIIRSQKDIFTKFVSDATIYCDAAVHIGYYCMNSNITAKEVILDSPKGQIIGGTINAEIKIVSSTIGSTSEKRTVINVSGFDRRQLKEKYENNGAALEQARADLVNIKQQLNIFQNTTQLTKQQFNQLEYIQQQYFEIKDRVKDLEDEKKALMGYLKTHGEGEIAVLKRAYPNTLISIKKASREIEKVILSTTFYYSDGDIKEL